MHRFIRSLKWKGQEEYANSERKIWKVNREIAGYSKVSRNLIYLFIRNAGHVAPHDKPEWTFDMINRFTAGKNF
jgi:vitellogenic carboxypeptidase-like protein